MSDQPAAGVEISLAPQRPECGGDREFRVCPPPTGTAALLAAKDNFGRTESIVLGITSPQFGRLTLDYRGRRFGSVPSRVQRTSSIRTGFAQML